MFDSTPVVQIINKQGSDTPRVDQMSVNQVVFGQKTGNSLFDKTPVVQMFFAQNSWNRPRVDSISVDQRLLSKGVRTYPC